MNVNHSHWQAYRYLLVFCFSWIHMCSISFCFGFSDFPRNVCKKKFRKMPKQVNDTQKPNHKFVSTCPVFTVIILVRYVHGCAVHDAFRVSGTTLKLNLIIIGLWPSNCCLSTFFLSYVCCRLIYARREKSERQNNKSILNTCFLQKKIHRYVQNVAEQQQQQQEKIGFFSDFLHNAII